MKVKLEELLSELGNPGKYQLIVFFLLCLNYFPLVFNHVIMAFFGMRPKYTCQLKSTLNGGWNSSYTELLSTAAVSAVSSTNLDTCTSTYVTQGGSNVTVTCPDDPDGVVVYDADDGFASIVTQVKNFYRMSLFKAKKTTGKLISATLFRKIK